MVTAYRSLFSAPAFRWFWTGFTVSALGDAMSQVALVWMVFDRTHSVETLGLFSVAYTGPVLVGGLAAGWILDRVDRRTVMLVDSLFRGLVMAAVPVLAAVGRLEIWHLFAVAIVYGLLKMVTLAGGPSVVPVIVAEHALDAANSMETLGWTISGVAGPAIAGLLIPSVGAATVLALDAASYLVFALALAKLPPMPIDRDSAAATGAGYAAAFRLVARVPALLVTTLMFMAFNVGQGLSFVWLPVLVREVLHAGAETYGFLLGAIAAGEVVGSVLAGSVRTGLSTGVRIAVAQGLSGLALGVAVVTASGADVGVALFAFGVFSAPLTIWAQSLRMRVIPPPLRGRTFALLRTLMQGAAPLGGGLGGAILPIIGIPLTIVASAAIIALPGAAGLLSRGLREADSRSNPAA